MVCGGGSVRDVVRIDVEESTMVRENEVREAEVTIEPPTATDAGLVFIGRIRTP